MGQHDGGGVGRVAEALIDLICSDAVAEVVVTARLPLVSPS